MASTCRDPRSECVLETDWVPEVAGRIMQSSSTLGTWISDAQRLDILSKSPNSLQLFKPGPASRQDPEDPPLFDSDSLCAAIFIKQRIGESDAKAFSSSRMQGTKVLAPVDTADPRAGAISFFINQRGYEDFLKYFGGVSSVDKALVLAMDDLISFDPYITYSRLKVIKPALNPRAFNIDPARLEYVSGVVQSASRQIAEVICESAAIVPEYTARLAAQILSNRYHPSLDALRKAMGMSREEFEEACFRWRLIIYYEHCLRDGRDQWNGFRASFSATMKNARYREIDASYNNIGADRSISYDLAASMEFIKIFNKEFEVLTRTGNIGVFSKILKNGMGDVKAIGLVISQIDFIRKMWQYFNGLDYVTDRQAGYSRFVFEVQKIV